MSSTYIQVSIQICTDFKVRHRISLTNAMTLHFTIACLVKPWQKESHLAVHSDCFHVLTPQLNVT